MVPGLQVPVHDAGSMRLVERVGDLNRILQTLLERQRAPLQAIGERLPFEILHDQKRDRLSGAYRRRVTRAQRGDLFANVVQRADVRVLDRGDRACLTVESLSELRVGCELG
jgi:hypothetical protein